MSGFLIKSKKVKPYGNKNIGGAVNKTPKVLFSNRHPITELKILWRAANGGQKLKRRILVVFTECYCTICDHLWHTVDGSWQESAGG